ncbi:hypothetical protein VPH35_051591 [Triticum aestivum]
MLHHRTTSPTPPHQLRRPLRYLPRVRAPFNRAPTTTSRGTAPPTFHRAAAPPTPSMAPPPPPRALPQPAATALPPSSPLLLREEAAPPFGLPTTTFPQHLPGDGSGRFRSITPPGNGSRSTHLPPRPHPGPLLSRRRGYEPPTLTARAPPSSPPGPTVNSDHAPAKHQPDLAGSGSTLLVHPLPSG